LLLQHGDKFAFERKLAMSRFVDELDLISVTARMSGIFGGNRKST